MTRREDGPARSAGTRVVVVDSGRLSRECLAGLLTHHGFDTVGAWDLPSLFRAVDAGAPEVILLNIRAEDSATMLHVSLDIGAGTKVVVYGLDAGRQSEVIACAEAGVAGLHLQSESFDHLVGLLRRAGEGQGQCSPEVSAILLRRAYAFATRPHPDSGTAILTRREKEILELIDQGLTNQQIASKLVLTVHTVKHHVHNLLAKLGVSSRAEAGAVARAEKYRNP